MHAGLGSEGTPPCDLPPMRRKYARHVSGWACEDEQRVNDGNRFQPDKGRWVPSSRRPTARRPRTYEVVGAITDNLITCSTISSRLRGLLITR
jgi:hypothetical protein